MCTDPEVAVAKRGTDPRRRAVDDGTSNGHGNMGGRGQWMYHDDDLRALSNAGFFFLIRSTRIGEYNKD